MMAACIADVSPGGGGAGVLTVGEEVGVRARTGKEVVVPLRLGGPFTA